MNMILKTYFYFEKSWTLNQMFQVEDKGVV